MKPDSISTGRLSPIDLVFSLMDSPRRPLDFTLLCHLRNAPDVEALRKGARSARNFYPTTGSYINKQHWVRFPQPEDGVAAISVSSPEHLTRAIEEFLDPRIAIE